MFFNNLQVQSDLTPDKVAKSGLLEYRIIRLPKYLHEVVFRINKNNWTLKEALEEFTPPKVDKLFL